MLDQMLKDLITLLNEFHEDHWVTYFSKSLKLCNNKDAYVAEYTLRAYGGMGSFNDLRLGKHDATPTKGFSLAKKNLELEKLREKIYEECSTISRST